MWQFTLLVFASIASSTLSQDVFHNCTFEMTRYDEYYCILENIEVLDRSANVIFGGEHVAGHDNDRVEFVFIRNSKTPFIIPQLFTSFPNIVNLEIDNSGLEFIELPNNISLTAIHLNDNNITRIENGTFRNQSQLLFFFAINNNVRVVEEGAFVGLSNLLSLELNENRITALAAGTFHPLTAVRHLDVESNILTRVEEGTFSENRALVSLFLESNRINAIARSFVDNLKENLTVLNLGSNICVDEFFVTNTEEQWGTMQEALETCYRNFETSDRKVKTVTLQFTGDLTIFNENGDLIVTINGQ